jgi:ABC-type uncharacterized transport system permease subunit
VKAKPYLTITRNGVMANLAYRGHFFFSLAGTVIYLVVTWFLWKAVYANGGTIGGLSFARAYLYVGISMSLYGLMQTGSDWYLYNMVRSGNVLRYLTQPIDFMSQFFAAALGDGIMNCVMIALPSLIIAFLLSGSGLPSPANVLLFIPSVAIGFLLNFFIDFITGLSVFLSQSISGIYQAKETTIMVLSGALVPLAFYPPGVRGVLEWLPFQALYTTPARILADGSAGVSEALPFLLRQAAWLIVFYLLTRLLFSVGLKRLVVNGG